MSGLAPKLLVFGFFGLFGVVGLVFLLIALSSAVHRAEFIHTAQRAEGTVIEMRPANGTRTRAGACVPVFRFMADDGQTYMVVSDVTVRRTAFSLGERVTVLYPEGHPENARINSFTPLWLFSMIFGIVGVVFLCVPGLLLLGRTRMRPGVTRIVIPIDRIGNS
jgi:uncharacterized membrane protein